MEAEGAKILGIEDLISNINKKKKGARERDRKYKRRNTARLHELRKSELEVKRNEQQITMENQNLEKDRLLLQSFQQVDQSNKDAQKQADQSNKVAQKQADESNKAFQEKLISKVADILFGSNTQGTPSDTPSDTPSRKPPPRQMGKPPPPPPPLPSGEKGTETPKKPPLYPRQNGELPPPPPLPSKTPKKPTPPPPPSHKGKPPPPPPLPPSGWRREFSTSNKRVYYVNMETGHSQWHFPTPSDIKNPAKAQDEANRRIQLEKPRIVKRPRETDEQRQPSSKKRAAVVFESGISQKERVAGVPLYQNHGFLYSEYNKDKPVSREAYLNQKHRADRLQIWIEALQDQNLVLKEANDSLDLTADYFALKHMYEKSKRCNAKLGRQFDVFKGKYGREKAENTCLKAENTRLKARIAHLEEQLGA